MPSSSNLLVKHYRVIYLAIFLVSILLLIASHYWLPHDTWVEVLAKELGFAGIVAVVLVFTIETFNHERHQLAADALLERINTSLFHAVYKRYIPEAVFEEVEKAVMMCSVYRTEHELDYTIEEFPLNTSPELRNNNLHCTAQTSYKLANLLDQDATHDIVVRIERPLDPQWEELCTVNELRVNGTPVLNLAQYIKRDDQHVTLTFPIQLKARSTVDVATKSTLLKKKTDLEVWCSRLPSDGLKLTVSTPSKGLIVKAVANHSEKLRPALANPVTRKWVLDFGIFPYQSIIFWWQPSEPLVV